MIQTRTSNEYCTGFQDTVHRISCITEWSLTPVCSYALTLPPREHFSEWMAYMRELGFFGRWIDSTLFQDVMSCSLVDNCQNFAGIFSFFTYVKTSHDIQEITFILSDLLITVAARSKAWTAFVRSDAGIVSSNSTRGMDLCVLCLCCSGCK
jgi:hypothetical protein